MKKTILLAAFLFLCGYWFLLKIGVPYVISHQVNDIREQGYDIQYTESYVGKAPLLMAWKFSDLSIQTKNDKENPKRIKLPDIFLELNPLSPFAMKISSGGAFEFQREGVGENEDHYSGIVKQLQAEANVTLSGNFEGVDLALELMNINIPSALESPLGTTIENLALEAEVKGELTIGHLQETMKHWFEDDGNVDIKDMTLTYGPMHMSANGSLGIDKDLQPVFSIKTKTTGLYQVTDLAVKYGYYSSLVRAKAHNVLDAMSLKGNERTGPVFEIEINLHDQQVSAGELWITKMGKIEW